MTLDDIRQAIADAHAGKPEAVERSKCWPRCSSGNYIDGGRWCRCCSPKPRELILADALQAVLDALDEEQAVCDTAERGRGWRHIHTAIMRKLEGK